ncbi:hypothetical protein M3Y99_01540300 [Aphelenchoides fujianensis]|nr:hypothetical protein M3Y99_01540300 [Aphelenchoides fujianensis]
MGTKMLYGCAVLLLAGHAGLFVWNSSDEWKTMENQKDDTTLQGSYLLAFISFLYTLRALTAIESSSKGNRWKLMAAPAANARFLCAWVVLWCVAVVISGLFARKQFFSYGLYFLLNELTALLILRAFKQEVKKYEEFIVRVQEANALNGRQPTRADAHAVFELLHQRRRLSEKSARGATQLREKLAAAQVDDFFTTSCWIHDLEALAAEDPQMSGALRPLVAQMRSRCEKWELSDEKRAQFLRLVQLGGPIVVPGLAGEPEVVIRPERPLAIAAEKHDAVSVPINEPPPEYEEKTPVEKANIV